MLPAGSRMMLTGGYKGRARDVEEDELLAMLATRLGLPTEAVVVDLPEGGGRAGKDGDRCNAKPMGRDSHDAFLLLT